MLYILNMFIWCAPNNTQEIILQHLVVYFSNFSYLQEAESVTDITQATRARF